MKPDESTIYGVQGEGKQRPGQGGTRRVEKSSPGQMERGHKQKGEERHAEVREVPEGDKR